MVELADLPGDAPFWLVDGVPVRLVGTQPRPQPGEAGGYSFVAVPDGAGDLSGTGAAAHADRYLALRDRAKHAGTVSVSVSIEDEVVYSVGRTDYDPLVAVEPGPYDEYGTAIWGLVTGSEDSTTLAEAVAQFSFDVTYIADRSRYDDKQAVRDAHERRGFH